MACSASDLRSKVWGSAFVFQFLLNCLSVWHKNLPSLVHCVNPHPVYGVIYNSYMITPHSFMVDLYSIHPACTLDWGSSSDIEKQKGSVTVFVGTSSAASAHPLQNLTNEYINEPARKGELDETNLTWALGDDVPEESEAHAKPEDRKASEQTVYKNALASKVSTDPLTTWISEEGGYIDPRLYLGTSPTLKCR